MKIDKVKMRPVPNHTGFLSRSIRVIFSVVNKPKEKEEKMKKRVFSFGIALLLLAGCSSVPLTGRKQVMLVSEQEVLTASLNQYSEFMKEAKVSSNKAQTEQVVRVGKRIAAATEEYLRNNGMASELSNFAWEFNLVASEDVNAFCMPGGKIVVYEGLMNIVASDDELAVVMGHEVAHAVAKHSNERMSQQLLSSYGGAILGVAVSQKSQMVQDLASSVYGLGAQYGVILPFSRKHESEADYMGLVFMTMANYNPAASVTFWQKMSAGKSSTVPEFLSTHPSDARRITELQQYIPEMEKYKKR